MASATAAGHPEQPVGSAGRDPFRRVFIYGLTVFSSAFLLFQVQPIISKLILPWFGGAVAVWTVCQLFFQVMLLLGYLYAYVLTQKFRPKVQIWTHVLLLAVSLLVLPILPPTYLKPYGSEDPALRVLLVLTLAVGFPFILLSSTSPLLQEWSSRSQFAKNGSPYRLYALSNAGSLLALLSYPIVVEPRISNRHQAIIWSMTYAGVAVLCAASAFSSRTGRRPAEVQPGDSMPDWRLKLLWAALAACGSALLLSVTIYISQNIAAVPLLWILPLSLYLLTYIVCFAGHKWYRRSLFLRLLVVALATMAYALAPTRGNLPPYILIPLFCGGLFACCMVCHGELAELKPHPTYLTSFYLLISFGGAVGAIFVAVIAPQVFVSGYYELPIALGLCGVLIQLALQRDRSMVSLFSRHAYLLGFVVVAALCAGLYLNATQQRTQARVAVRNFYGLLRVEDRVAPGVVLIEGHTSPLLDPDPRYRDLINGTIEHGIQFLAADRRRETTTYYGSNSGIGLALKAAGRKGSVNAGIIGLGAGTVAAYGRAGDQYTFYEINPLVIELANNMFTFLKQSLAQVKIVPGDARLSLERQSPQQFDVLAVDAFSSDAIPTHLLTREAFQLYLRHIKSAGVIAVHVSNRFLDLVPVVRAAAASLGRESLVIESDADDKRAIYRATWVLVGGAALLGQSELKTAAETPTTKRLSLWTDDYSSILRAFK